MLNHVSGVLSNFLRTHLLYCVFMLVSVPCAILHFGVIAGQLDAIIFFVVTLAIPLLTGEQPYLLFEAALAETDSVARWHRIPRDSLFVYIFLFFIVIGEIITHIMYTNATFHPLVNMGYSFISVSLDLEPLVKVSIFGMMHQRMMLLRESFQNISTSIGIDPEVNKSTQINHNIKIYKRLLDCLLAVNANIQITFAIALMRVANRTMMIFVAVVAGEGAEKEVPAAAVIQVLLIHITYVVIMNSAPCMLLELAENEVDHILKVLRNLAFDPDQRVRVAACSGARYVSLRPLRVQLARVLPLDSTMPIALASFCFTCVSIQLQLYVF